MARTRKALPARVDVAHLISAGVLASVCPRALIEEVLADHRKASQRERLLPAPALVYYVMALALWREAPLEEVLRVVCEGLQWLGGGDCRRRASQQVGDLAGAHPAGSEVMRQLAERVLRPLAAPGAPGAWYGASGHGAGRQLHGGPTRRPMPSTSATRALHAVRAPSRQARLLAWWNAARMW